MANSDDENRTGKTFPMRTAQDHRRERAARKLRENLQRRKLQQRARRAGAADEAEGLPAANSSQDDD